MSTSVASASTLKTGLIINGEVVDTDTWTPVYDPAEPSSVVGYSASASVGHSRAAVDAASAAFTSWSAMPVTERVDLILAALNAVEQQQQSLSHLLVRENGKILAEAEIDVAVFGVRVRAACALGHEVSNPVHLSGPPFRTEVHRLPVGVVTIIVPFNWPLAILAASLPYALVAGNSVVVKPPPTAPLAVVSALEIMSLELPPGVLNVVTGDNANVEPLITDPRVQHVVFTGSTSAGKRIMTLAAETLTKVTLELGGNDPAIVLDDIDLNNQILSDLVAATYLTAGQVGMGVKRIYVARQRFDELVDGMGSVLDSMLIGRGTNPKVTMGPLHTGAQKTYVRDLVQQAQESGAEVREFGSYSDDVDEHRGHFLKPTLVLDPDVNQKVVTEEQFGPTVPVIPFDNVDSLVGQLNSEWSGLCSSVWSGDEERAGKIARGLRTGTSWVNQANAGACDDRAPFGGFRQSGLGREMGTEGLVDFTEAHTVTFRQ